VTGVATFCWQNTNIAKHDVPILCLFLWMAVKTMRLYLYSRIVWNKLPLCQK